MKSSQECPKCRSGNVALLGGTTFNSQIYPFGHNDTGYSLVARYACVECGFVEEYLVDPSELAALRKSLG